MIAEDPRQTGHCAKGEMKLATTHPAARLGIEWTAQL
jgi:hypothetical protein